MKPLVVGIDASSLPYGRGVSRYISNIIKELAARPDVELQLFGAMGRSRGRFLQWARELRGKPAARFYPLSAGMMETAWTLLGSLSVQFLAPGAEVIHAWEWQLPPRSGAAIVVNIHDLAHVLYPETAHPRIVKQFEKLFERLRRDTDIQIIAISDSTKKDITRVLGIDPDRVTKIHAALPEEAKIVANDAEITAARQKFGIERPFFLFVGTTEPRKNLQRVVQAWQEGELDTTHDLVLAGAAGWEDLPNVAGLKQLGYVSDVELASLYQSASALVFPSLYEGFGFPVLEAFFHACPVVTSRVSSLPEVGGDAAEYVDPYSVSDIAQAMKKLSRLSPLQKTALQKKMTKQLNTFSWQRAAAETLEVYRKASRA